MTNLEKLDTLPGLRAELEREKEARWQAEKHCIDADRSAAAAANRAEMLLARAEQAERELTAWRAETGAGRPEDAGAAIRNTREDVKQAEKERDEARTELARVQGLPELEWAQVAAVIMQGLALHARTDQPAAKRMAEALDKAKTYVGRLKERAERAEADNAALLKDRLEMCPTCCGRNVYAKESPNGTEMEDVPCPSCAYVRKQHHPGAALHEYVRALEAVREQLRDDVSAGCIVLVDECRELSKACRAADALKGKR